ncbi:MAG TPA: FliG C-terminal domain-containing protein [Spirochaetia bacterium]|nr:FliG C-terminal domain-containing protein [Spirochaetia bacterium]
MGFIRETSRDAGYRKAAQFLMLLGKEEAARVLRHLAPQEVEGITREIARTQKIDERDATKVLEEFGYLSQTRALIAQGGIDKAQEMLVASVGAEKAREIIEKVRKDMAPPPFTFLKDVDVHQVIALVRQESAPVAALILAHLEPKLAARILQALSPEVQREVVGRIAKMQQVSPEVLRRAEEALKSKVRDLGEPATQEVDGTQTLTAILRLMDPTREQAILSDLDPNTANQIRKMLYTIEVVFQIPDKDLQKILRDYADREIAMVLKGVSDEVGARITSSISEHRRDLVKLESDAMGPARRADVDRAIQDFLEYIQLLEQKGEIAILREREKFV